MSCGSRTCRTPARLLIMCAIMSAPRVPLDRLSGKCAQNLSLFVDRFLFRKKICWRKNGENTNLRERQLIYRMKTKLFPTHSNLTEATNTSSHRSESHQSRRFRQFDRQRKALRKCATRWFGAGPAITSGTPDAQNGAKRQGNAWTQKSFLLIRASAVRRLAARGCAIV